MNIFLLSMLSLIYTSCQQSVGEIALVEQGKAKYVIVTPAQPTKAESKAAGIFQDYVQRIAGAKLTVIAETQYKKEVPAVFIGNTAQTAGPSTIKAEGFYIGTGNGQVYIRGGSGQGVVYGVYHMLEKYLGCRKDDQGPAFVPASKTIRLKDNISELKEPAFRYRETYYPASMDPEYLSWHGLHRFEDLWGIWGHAFFKIIPPKTFFKEHPEYYSLVNGKRQPMQLCLSNEKVAALTIEWFRKAIAANPDAMYWSISAEDGPGACSCENCSKIDAVEGGPQGSLIRFVNKVAQVFPEQSFTTLAYGHTAKAPLKTKPAANVYIMLSTIDAFRQQPLAQEKSAAAFRKNLADWGNLTGNLFIWDYTTQFTNYLTPFPDYNNLQPNLQFFARHQVKGVFSQGSGETWSDMAAWNSYVQSRLLWQPDADSKVISDEFLKGYYGPAAPHITEYLNALSEAVKNTGSTLDIYGNPFYSAAGYLSPELIDRYLISLDKAKAAVAGNNNLLQRVANVRLSLEYVVLQQSRYYGTEKRGYLRQDGSLQPEWPERVKQFVAQCKQVGVSELSEGGLSPDAYAAEWQELFERKWAPGLAFGAPVKLTNAFTPEYSPKKERTLTDGLQGGKDFSYNWLFTYDKDMIAVIDLGATKAIRQVDMNFLQDARHYIFPPKQILIEVSEDGQRFEVAGRKEIAVPEEDFAIYIRPYAFSMEAKQGRYIRITATCPADLPDWRKIAGKKPALCCDEIHVQ